MNKNGEVNSENFESNKKGIFAVGDICLSGLVTIWFS